MNTSFKYSIIIFLFAILFSCNTTPVKTKTKTTTTNKKIKTVTAKTIILIPLGKIDNAVVNEIYNSIKRIIPDIKIIQKESMPSNSYYRPTNRYKADTLINWMSKRAKENEIYVGITTLDISHTKDENQDYGIMGLGFQPGKACVASSFRLKNKASFFKVVIHELGHTSGLPHCPEKACFMRDAEGHDSTAEETDFCTKCKSYLISKGWDL